MQHTTVKIRRGRRTDLPALTALLSPTAAPAAGREHARHWRRLAGDPAHDFYVAEQDGTVRGAVLVSYVRSLTRQGWHAILDVAAPGSTVCDVGRQLLEFAKGRARRRGCRALCVCVGDRDGADRLALVARGGFLRAGEVLSCGL